MGLPHLLVRGSAGQIPSTRKTKCVLWRDSRHALQQSTSDPLSTALSRPVPGSSSTLTLEMDAKDDGDTNERETVGVGTSEPRFQAHDAEAVDMLSSVEDLRRLLAAVYIAITRRAVRDLHFLAEHL